MVHSVDSRLKLRFLGNLGMVSAKGARHNLVFVWIHHKIKNTHKGVKMKMISAWILSVLRMNEQS
jgi:hypothetical protein